MLDHTLSPITLLPILAVGILFEIGWYRVAKRAYPWTETTTSIGIFALRLLGKGLRAAVFLPVIAFLYTHRIATIPLDAWWGWVLLFFAEEFCYYWSHRAGHEIRWMWATHSVHHTPSEIHLASALRLGVTGILSGDWLFFLPLYFIGFHPVAVGAMIALNLAYQFWLHTDIIGRLGPLEWFFNTPSHHRVHHASNAAYLDRNYGGIVILWDRLFGTFAEERADVAIRYGLVHPVAASNLPAILLQPWIEMARDAFAAATWRARWRQLFGRPADSASAQQMSEAAVPSRAG